MRQGLKLPLAWRSAATRIAIIFLVWSVLWLTLSDYAMRNIASSLPGFWRLQSEKCLLYLAVSTILLVLALRAAEQDQAGEPAISEAQLRVLKESGLIAIAIWADDKQIRHANEAFCQMVGYTQAELVGKDVRQLMPQESQCNAAEAFEETGAPGQTSLRRGQLVRRDGTPISVLGGVAVLPATKQQVSFFVDVSEFFRTEEERMKLQQQILHSEKVNALGQLAGGVAHNFNNELAVIVGYASMIEAKSDPDEVNHRNAAEVLRAAERARKLVKQLLAFSRKQPLRRETVDVNSLIQEMHPMLRLAIRDGVELRVNLSHEEECIEIDSAQFEQALLNLVLNARDAMPAGGLLTIDIGHHLRDMGGISFADRDREYVTIRISDTGIGMDAATRSRVFEPFFTTKQQKGGTGLGLATVHGIVKQSGGDISLTSNPNTGSSFILQFPRAQRKPVAELVHMPSRKPPAMRGTVLVVEDLEPLRDMTTEILRTQGLTVLPARDGLHALEIARNAGAIDLVLTDVVMPRMSGPEAVRLIREAHPEIKVIYSSGFTDLDGPTQDDVVIWKPVRPETLIKAVQDCLQGVSMPPEENSLAG